MVSSVPFAELAVRSHFSFLEGSASPRDLVEVAARLEIGSLGLCDRNGLCGVVAFIEVARKAGIRPVVGVELDLVDAGRIGLLARGRRGYRPLCRAPAPPQPPGSRGRPRLRIAGLADDPPGVEAREAPPPRLRRRPTLPPPSRPQALRPTAGPFPEGWPSLPSTRDRVESQPAVVDPADLDDCIALAGGPESAVVAALVAGDRRGAQRLAERLRECFGRDRAALLLTNHRPPAASTPPPPATRANKPLLDVLTAIRHRTTLDQAAAHGLLLPNCEHRLLSEAGVRRRLADFPDAFDHAARIAAQCSLDLDFTEVRFPGFPVPEGESPFSVLYGLCQDQVRRRYRPLTPLVAQRLHTE